MSLDVVLDAAICRYAQKCLRQLEICASRYVRNSSLSELQPVQQAIISAQHTFTDNIRRRISSKSSIADDQFGVAKALQSRIRIS
eukprot:3072829-Pleurochrysis_carterae.AAC.1